MMGVSNMSVFFNGHSSGHDNLGDEIWGICVRVVEAHFSEAGAYVDYGYWLVTRSIAHFTLQTNFCYYALYICFDSILAKERMINQFIFQI